MTQRTSYRVGIDIGGTFTDLALLGTDGRLITRKVSSTPDDYGRGTLHTGDDPGPDGVAGNADDTVNYERTAVGLDIDHDGNAATPRVQPSRYTENGLRSELGLTRRPRY